MDKTVPSSAPVINEGETKAEDAHTIRVTWQEIVPKDQNGIIQGYTVFYNVKDQPTQFSQKAPATNAIIRGLKPYTNYCIRVAGYNGIGLSPKSDCKYVETLQSGTNCTLHFIVHAIATVFFFEQYCTCSYMFIMPMYGPTDGIS